MSTMMNKIQYKKEDVDLTIFEKAHRAYIMYMITSQRKT